MIVLRSHYARLIAANGIVPVTADHWMNTPETFDRYFMLGLPGERIDPLENGVYTARPAMFSISRLDQKTQSFGYQTDPTATTSM